MSALPSEIPETDPAPISVKNDALPDIENKVSDPLVENEPVLVETKETNGALKDGEDDEGAENATSEHKIIKETDMNGDEKTKPQLSKEGLLKTSPTFVKSGENHSKYDPSVLPTTDDPQKIRAQVEFYFGDANLPTDKFMWETTDGESNRPVPIKTICNFGRMKRFNPYSAIVTALKDSQFLEVSGEEGEETVKRKIAYDPNAPWSRTETRSVYVKGFGDEEPSSQFDIEAFFAPFGPTNAVRLRRTPEKLFKGSVFVEFADEEIARKFLALPEKPLWKGEHVLKIMSKKEYTDLKMEEIKSGKIDPAGHEHWQRRGRGRGGNRQGNNRGNSGGRENRSHCDLNDWKKRREDDRASGFKKSRGNRRDNTHKGSRGDRGGRRGNRSRNDDRNREHKEQTGESEANKSEATPNNAAEPQTAPSPSKKREYEDDGAEQRGSKKIDIKPDIVAEP